MVALSVVIPTFNRASRLSDCLEHLAAQSSGAGTFEVVVADDHSTDDTAEVVSRWKQAGQLEVSYVHCVKGFAGAARNRGVEHASGERILFLGDDILAAPDLVERHLEAAALYGSDAAVVGAVSLDRESYSPFMDYLETTGTHHAFPQLRERVGSPLPGWYFYACNASVPRAAHDRIGGFDETILRAYEDGEYGARLVRAGCPLFFVPSAKGVHVHPTTVDRYVAFLRNGRSDIAAVTRLAIAAGEGQPEVGYHPIADRLALDRPVELSATVLARIDRRVPRRLRWRLYAAMLGYERRKAYLEAGVGPS